jgi:uncharacterized repeat protein (TIGR01451 family)
MAAPGAPLQVCALVTYALGFANPNNTPNIGVYAMVAPTDAVSSGIRMRVERCTGALCVGFTLVGNSNGVQFPLSLAPQAEFIDSGVYGTIYRYRVRLENDDGVGPFSSIVQIDTTVQGTSSCDSGAITDFTPQVNATDLREVVESTADQVRATGLREGVEWGLTEDRATGLREVVESLLTQVQATGLRIIIEYLESAAIDLVVEKTNNAPSPFPGDFVTWTVTVTNTSANDATGVLLSDLLPDGVFFSSYTASQGTYDPVEGVWNVGDLAAGASATIDIVVIVGLIGPNPGDEEICNLAIATANQPDTDDSNNQAVDCIVVQPPIGPPTDVCPPENPPPIPPIPIDECPPRLPPDVLNYSVPFRLYQRDFEVRAKSWGDDGAYAILRPQGGPSYEKGAEI